MAALPRDDPGLEQCDHPDSGWLGVDGVLAVVTGIAGAEAVVSAGDFRDLRNNSPTSATASAAERDSVAKRASTYGVVADVALVATIIAGGVSLDLTLRGNPVSRKTRMEIRAQFLSGSF